MQFLVLRGHTRLIPQGGFAEFPDAVLNAKRLDLFNLYREVRHFELVKVTAYYIVFGDTVSKTLEYFRLFQEEAFTLVMVSIGKDKFSQR